MKNHLLVIDPQEDFCDPKGSLFVPGADADMKRLATFIEKNKNNIEDIHVTLDSHHLVDVAHPIFWQNSDGENPEPFTIITSNDIKDGKWAPANPSWRKRMLDYVGSLEQGGRYPLCIWPPHCLIGSSGATVYKVLYDALLDWESGFAYVDYVTKGSNLFTEHYSAVQAEIPDPKDPTTHINTDLIQTLMDAERIYIAGEAGSHCLANTVRDIANAFQDDSYISRLVLIKDATSPVPSFENFQEDFIKEMTARGMKMTTTEELI